MDRDTVSSKIRQQEEIAKYFQNTHFGLYRELQAVIANMKEVRDSLPLE